jgi:hypothetical protein
MARKGKFKNSTSYAPGVSTGPAPKKGRNKGNFPGKTNKSAKGVDAPTKQQSKSKERSQRWMSAGRREGIGEKAQARNDKRLGHLDIKTMAAKKGISEQEAWNRASKLGIDTSNMGGYAKYKTGNSDPGISDISEYKANMIGMEYKKGENKGQTKNVYRLGDVKYLKDQGYSHDEIAQHINDNHQAEGARLGRSVQNFLNRWKERVANKPPGTVEPENPGTPGGPTNPEPVAPPPPATSPGNNAEATATAEATANQNINSGNIDGDITTGDINNTGGYIGQIGHTNNSVTIGYNNAGANANANAHAGGGAGGPSGSGGETNGSESWSGPANDPLANLMGGMAYQALNTNAWHRSQSDLNGSDRAAQAVALNNTLTNSKEISAGYAQRAINGTDRMYKLAQNQWADTMGDTWRYQPPNWQMPEEPEEITSNTEELTEEAYDKMGL